MKPTWLGLFFLLTAAGLCAAQHPVPEKTDDGESHDQGDESKSHHLRHLLDHLLPHHQEKYDGEHDKTKNEKDVENTKEHDDNAKSEEKLSPDHTSHSKADQQGVGGADPPKVPEEEIMSDHVAKPDHDEHKTPENEHVVTKDEKKEHVGGRKMPEGHDETPITEIPSKSGQNDGEATDAHPNQVPEKHNGEPDKALNPDHHDHKDDNLRIEIEEEKTENNEKGTESIETHDKAPHINSSDRQENPSKPEEIDDKTLESHPPQVPETLEDEMEQSTNPNDEHDQNRKEEKINDDGEGDKIPMSHDTILGLDSPTHSKLDEKRKDEPFPHSSKVPGEHMAIGTPDETKEPEQSDQLKDHDHGNKKDKEVDSKEDEKRKGISDHNNEDELYPYKSSTFLGGDEAKGTHDETKESEYTSHPKDLEQGNKKVEKHDLKENSKEHDEGEGSNNPNESTVVDTDEKVEKNDKHERGTQSPKNPDKVPHIQSSDDAEPEGIDDKKPKSLPPQVPGEHEAIGTPDDETKKSEQSDQLKDHNDDKKKAKEVDSKEHDKGKGISDHNNEDELDPHKSSKVPEEHKESETPEATMKTLKYHHPEDYKHREEMDEEEYEETKVHNEPKTPGKQDKLPVSNFHSSPGSDGKHGGADSNSSKVPGDGRPLNQSGEPTKTDPPKHHDQGAGKRTEDYGKTSEGKDGAKETNKKEDEKAIPSSGPKSQDDETPSNHKEDQQQDKKQQDQDNQNPAPVQFPLFDPLKEPISIQEEKDDSPKPLEQPGHNPHQGHYQNKQEDLFSYIDLIVHQEKLIEILNKILDKWLGKEDKKHDHDHKRQKDDENSKGEQKPSDHKRPHNQGHQDSYPPHGPTHDFPPGHPPPNSVPQNSPPVHQQYPPPQHEQSNNRGSHQNNPGQFQPPKNFPPGDKSKPFQPNPHHHPYSEQQTDYFPSNYGPPQQGPPSPNSGPKYPSSHSDSVDCPPPYNLNQNHQTYPKPFNPQANYSPWTHSEQSQDHSPQFPPFPHSSASPVPQQNPQLGLINEAERCNEHFGRPTQNPLAQHIHPSPQPTGFNPLSPAPGSYRGPTPHPAAYSNPDSQPSYFPHVRSNLPTVTYPGHGGQSYPPTVDHLPSPQPSYHPPPYTPKPHPEPTHCTPTPPPCPEPPKHHYPPPPPPPCPEPSKHHYPPPPPPPCPEPPKHHYPPPPPPPCPEPPKHHYPPPPPPPCPEPPKHHYPPPPPLCPEPPKHHYPQPPPLCPEPTNTHYPPSPPLCSPTSTSCPDLPKHHYPSPAPICPPTPPPHPLTTTPHPPTPTPCPEPPKHNPCSPQAPPTGSQPPTLTERVYHHHHIIANNPKTASDPNSYEYQGKTDLSYRSSEIPDHYALSSEERASLFTHIHKILSKSDNPSQKSLSPDLAAQLLQTYYSSSKNSPKFAGPEPEACFVPVICQSQRTSQPLTIQKLLKLNPREEELIPSPNLYKKKQDTDYLVVRRPSESRPKHYPPNQDSSSADDSKPELLIQIRKKETNPRDKHNKNDQHNCVTFNPLPQPPPTFYPNQHFLSVPPPAHPLLPVLYNC